MNNVHIKKIKKSSAKFEDWFLLRSDSHSDSLHYDSRLEMKHLNQALERNAKIIDLGDLFDAKQGKKDPRASKSGQQGKRDDYFNEIVEQKIKRYYPFKNIWFYQGYGNHETSIIKHNEIDLLKLFCDGIGIDAGFYSGYLVLKYDINGHTARFIINVYHGKGGNSPVTHGVINANRKAVWCPDADLYLTGHIHKSWHLDTVQERINNANKIYYKENTFLQLPTYQYKRPDGNGWENEMDFPPSPLGAYWLRITYDSTESKLISEIMRAK